MGYSTSRATLEAMIPYLRTISSGRETQWRPAEGTLPEQWAYKVREALWIAKRYAPEYPSLARAHSIFQITCESGIVKARYKAGAKEISAFETQDPEFLQPTSYTRELIGPQNVYEIIQYWIDSQPSNDEIHVSEIQLTNTELSDLQKWAAAQTPRWEVAHQLGDTHLTIRPARDRKLATMKMPIKTARVGDKPDYEVPG